MYVCTVEIYLKFFESVLSVALRSTILAELCRFLEQQQKIKQLS